MTSFGARSRRRSAFVAPGFLLILSGWSLFAQVAPAAPVVASAPETVGPVVPGKFTDVTAASGVRFIGVAWHTSHKYLLETMGSGVAVFDYDNDGLLDLFFVNGAPLDDPMAKDAIPEKRSPKVEPVIPPAQGRHLRRRDRKIRVEGCWIWDGSRRRRLR